MAAGTPEGPAEAQTAQAALDVAQLNLSALQADIANNVSKSQIHDDRKALQASVVNLIHVGHDLEKDIIDDGGTSADAASVDAVIDTFLDDVHDVKRDLN